MDILPSVDLLREHLVRHDYAIRQIMVLDGYIEQMCEQTFLSTMGDHLTPAFQKMIRIAVAEGMKRMYKEYRLQKWIKVQEMAATVRRVIQSDLAEMALAETQQPTNNQVISYNPQPEYNTLPWQQQQEVNNNWQMAAPQAFNWHPVTDNWQPSPMATPILQLVSPISTPHNGSRRDITPGRYEQFSIATHTTTNTSHVISRQLFPDNLYSDNTYPESDIIYSDCEEFSENVSSFSSSETWNRSSAEIDSESVHRIPVIVGNRVSTDHEESDDSEEFTQNQSDFQIHHHDHTDNFSYHPQQQQNVAEHQNDTEQEMEWESDSDDSDYDEEEENLAHILFATQLLPDEQAIRLDVEMGDMGIGHMLFDRVSATWYTSHCEFYRAD